MKTLIATSLAIIFVFVATMASADHKRRGHNGYVSKDDRIERHLDRKGDRIERHFDRKADRFRARDDRIDRHLNRKGKRFHARHDHRKSHKHYKKHRHDRRDRYETRRHHHPKPRVIYRGYAPHDTYLGLVINQPGLWLGWGWHD